MSVRLRCAALGVWLLSVGRVAAAPSGDGGEIDPSESSRRDAAKAAFRHGREAAAAGDYAEALAGFEEALRLEPSPGIHYNIAACHHRLMLEATEGSSRYRDARREAIDAYNRYLRAAPEAEDRQHVEELIRSLGGQPVTQKRWTVERIDPNPAPELRNAANEIDDGDGSRDDRARAAPRTPDDAKTTDAPRPKPETGRMPSARLGLGVVLATSNMRQLTKTPEIETLPMLGLTLRGGAFLGLRHRINLGGEVGLYGQPSGTSSRHRLNGGHIGVTVDYGHTVGKRRRFELGGGGMIALAGQNLRHKGSSSASCPTSTGDGDREISKRGGIVLGPRLTLAALLGRRRNHELALRITPGVGFFGLGNKGNETAGGDPCADFPTPFEEFGLGRPALVVTVDLGYAPRF